jgi:hypothetical protein
VAGSEGETEHGHDLRRDSAPRRASGDEDRLRSPWTSLSRALTASTLEVREELHADDSGFQSGDGCGAIIGAVLDRFHDDRATCLTVSHPF